jgi:hypothetical protein
MEDTVPVTLTSPVLGLDVGAVYTGDEEEFLLAQGYARRDGYTGPGVSNTGPAAQTPAEDLTLAENREPAPSHDEQGREDAGPLDPAMILPGDAADTGGEDYDFDEGGVNDDPPTFESVEPATGPAAGGTVVTISGQNFTGATGVTFDGVAGTAFSVESDTEISVTTPTGSAGTADVVVTNANGTDTGVAAFTYTA